jgi:hypothetical protein
VVSGATGGVGVSILKKLGYRAIREKLNEWSWRLIIMREDFESMDNKPLLKPAFVVL